MSTPNKPATSDGNTRRRSFAVAASPFNAVKLELALIIVAAIVFWLVVERLYPGRVEAMLLLSGYGAVAAGWIFFRVHRVLRRLSSREET